MIKPVTMYSVVCDRCGKQFVDEFNGFEAIMTREELQNKLDNNICEYCNKNIISKYNIGIGRICEGKYCEEAQDGYSAENNI